MKKLLKNKKVLVAAALATILAIGGATYAWFTDGKEVVGGSLEMAKIQVQVSDLLEFKPDTDPNSPTFGTEIGVPVTSVDDLYPSSERVIGYEVRTPADAGYAIVYLGDLGLADVDIKTEGVGPAPGYFAIWPADPADAIGITPLANCPGIDIGAAVADYDANEVSFLVDTINNMYFAYMPGGSSISLKYDVTFDKDLGNLYQGAEIGVDGLTVLAAQLSEDDEAIETLLADFGIVYDFTANELDGTLVYQ